MIVDEASFRALVAEHGGVEQALIACPDVCAVLAELVVNDGEVPAGTRDQVLRIWWWQSMGYRITFTP